MKKGSSMEQTIIYLVIALFGILAVLLFLWRLSG